MANIDDPRGLVPTMHLDGKPWNGGTWKCFCSSSDSTAAIFVGDPVIHNGGACTKGCCMDVIIALTGDGVEVLGIVSSVDPAGMSANHIMSNSADITGSAPYRLVSTTRFMNVVFDPDVLYSVQGDSAGAITYTDMCGNANMLKSDHTGNTITGVSGVELDSASVTEDKSLQLWIWGAVDHPDNDITAVNADFLVLLNTSVHTGTLGRVLGVTAA